MSLLSKTGRHVHEQEQGKHAGGYAPVRIAPRIVPAALAGTLLLVACFVVFMAISPLYVSQVLGGRSLFAGAAILDDSFDVCLDIQQDLTQHAQLAYDASSFENADAGDGEGISAADAAFAYAEAIAPRAAYERFTSDDAQAVLRTAYVSVCAGRPVVLHAALASGEERWVVVVGFQNVRDLGALAPENFLVIDPVQEGDGVPIPFDCQGVQLVGAGTELSIAQASIAVVSGEQVLVLPHGAKAVQSGGTTQWSCLASTQTSSLAALLVDETFGTCDTVVLVGEENSRDALVATGLAGAIGCPILPLSHDESVERVQARLAHLGATRTIIVGDDDAVGQSVEQQLAGMPGLSVERIVGDDEAGTAIAALHAGEGLWGDTAVVVSANGPYEALSIAPYVYARHAPVFLAVGVRGQLDAAAYENLAEFQRVIIVGDAEAVADSVEVQLEQNGIEVVRLFGGEAGLSTTIAEWCLGEGLAADGLGIALDSDEAIALVAGACCGKTGSVLMLSAGDDSAAVVKFARAHASHMAKAWVCSSGSATAAFARLVEATS